MSERRKRRFGWLAALAVAGAQAAAAAEIHDAARLKDVDRVRAILAKDADQANAVSTGALTPLHVAAVVNSPEIAALLLDAGADINARTDVEYTPLHLAASANGNAVVELLMRRGADITALTDDGKTPLQLAVKRKAPDTIKALAVSADATYATLLSDPRKVTGEAWVARQELERAYEVFVQLFMEDPGSEKLNFGMGLIAYSLKKYDHAALAFERLVHINPMHHRGRLELARAYMARGQGDQAQREFEAVLPHVDDPAVRANIHAQIRQAMEATKTWHFQGRLDLGVFYDSNVNVGPDSDIISIAPIIFQAQLIDALLVSEESQPADSPGVFLTLNGAALRDFGVHEKWIFVAEATAHGSRLDGQREQEVLYGKVAAGLKYIGLRHRVDLPAKVAHLALGGDSLVTVYGVNPVYSGSPGRRGWRYTTRAAFEYRDYTDRDDRDGPFVQVEEIVTRYFGERRHSLSLSGGWFGEFADGDTEANDGFDVGVAVNYFLQKKLSIYSLARYRWIKYDEAGPLEIEPRSDDERGFAVGLTRVMGQKWTMDVNYTRTDSVSSFDLNTYERDQATLTSTLTF